MTMAPPSPVVIVFTAWKLSTAMAECAQSPTVRQVPSRSRYTSRQPAAVRRPIMASPLGRAATTTVTSQSAPERPMSVNVDVNGEAMPSRCLDLVTPRSLLQIVG